MTTKQLVYSELRKAGAFIFVGVAQFAVLLIVAEALFPNYSVSNNYISDLGAICHRPPAPLNGCVFVQPTSSVFNGSIIFLGVFLIIATYFLLRSKVSMVVPVFTLLSAIGCIGVGTFTEATGTPHGIFSLLTFVSIGLLALVSYGVQKSPLKYFSIVAGVATLASLVLFMTGVYLGLGIGGMERMIVYPVMVWSLAFSGHLMALEEAKATPKSA